MTLLTIRKKARYYVPNFPLAEAMTHTFPIGGMTHRNVCTLMYVPVLV